MSGLHGAGVGCGRWGRRAGAVAARHGEAPCDRRQTSSADIALGRTAPGKPDVAASEVVAGSRRSGGRLQHSWRPGRGGSETPSRIAAPAGRSRRRPGGGDVLADRVVRSAAPSLRRPATTAATAIDHPKLQPPARTGGTAWSGGTRGRPRWAGRWAPATQSRKVTPDHRPAAAVAAAEHDQASGRSVRRPRPGPREGGQVRQVDRCRSPSGCCDGRSAAEVQRGVGEGGDQHRDGSLATASGVGRRTQSPRIEQTCLYSRRHHRPAGRAVAVEEGLHRRVAGPSRTR